MSNTTIEAAGLHSPLAEDAVIGGIMLDPDAIHRVGALRPEDFYEQRNRVAFRAMQRLVAADRPLDLVTLAEALEASGELDRVGGLSRLTAIRDNTPGAQNVAAYAETVMERARLRYGLMALEDAKKMLLEAKGRDVDQVLVTGASRLESIVGRDSAGYMHISEVIDAALTQAKAAHDAQRRGVQLGIHTGLPELDEMTGGLHGERLYVYAGRPGVGKSALKLQTAINAALSGKGVGIISLEMGGAEMGFRSIANTLAINGSKLARGDGATFERMMGLLTSDKLATLRDAPLYFDFQSSALPEVVSRIQQWKRQHDIGLAVVDHIGLVETTGYASRVEQIGAITRSLKKLTERLHMPILALAQLNRASQYSDGEIELHHLRDSGNIEQDADVVVALRALDDIGQEVRVSVLKNRGGPRGFISDVRFNGRYQRFEAVAKSAVAEDDEVPMSG